jgi:hypothetical protein
MSLARCSGAMRRLHEPQDNARHLGVSQSLRLSGTATSACDGERLNTADCVSRCAVAWLGNLLIARDIL